MSQKCASEDDLERCFVDCLALGKVGAGHSLSWGERIPQTTQSVSAVLAQ